MHSYTAALEAFARAVGLMPRPLERVEVDSPDGILPGYLIPSGTDGPAPVVIFYNGFDVTKELLYGFIGDQFSRRGIACLVIDAPGTGKPRRLCNIPSRPDYEVPTANDPDPPGSSSSTGSPGASAPCPRRPPDPTGRRGKAAVAGAGMPTTPRSAGATMPRGACPADAPTRCQAPRCRRPHEGRCGGW